ncbi:hypothetical protein CR513_14494, partial [Mucuna pruriens]
MVKLVKKEEQSKKEGSPRKEKELGGLFEDFYNQYQSLYSLYGRLTGEHVKASPCVLDRLSSVSSSSSECDYFSAEELDVTTDITFSRDKERSTLSTNTPQVFLKTQASNQFEEQLSTHAREVKLLCEKNSELHGRVLELELSLRESEETVSVLQAKLKTNEDHSASKVGELMARISKLEQEAKSLRKQKGKMEEKIRRSNRNEASSQKKDFADQINFMQQKLDSVSNRNKELEAQLEREREQVSRCLVRIENLGENLAESKSIEKNLVKEKECFLARIKDLELEMESRCSKERDLVDRNGELVRAMAQRGEEISELVREHESCKEEASTHAKALKCEVENLRMKLDTLKEEKEDQELLLREKVWKLEAKVSKEGGEKLNLMKAVSQLERKVGKLDKNLREKNDELIGLGEKKREAIRQLCLLVEFHRNRCVYLNDLMSKRRVISNRK